jgi:predicted ATP pyrophosphatase (TIGR00289 family)
MRSAVLYSGGKDSTMAVYHSLKNGDEVQCLVSMISKNDASYMYHVPNIRMTNFCAKAMDIPLIEVTTEGEKEKELDDLENILTRLKSKGIEAIYSGAIESVYQRSRIDAICEKLELKSIAPLWHQDPLEYMNQIIDLGFEVIITSVAAYGLDKKWLGKTINKETIEELVKLHDKYRIHLAFEGGEAETLVLDGPIFNKRIIIDDSTINWHLDNGLYQINKAHLEDK